MKQALDVVLRIANKISLVTQILIGIIAGTLLAIVAPEAATTVGLLGSLFVSALKAVAPILVFVLVISAIANHQHGSKTSIKPILSLYVIGTFVAALTAVLVSFAFPTELVLAINAAQASPPKGIAEVLQTILFKVVDNPINAILTGNFIGVLAWAIGLGLAMRHGAQSSKHLLSDIARSVTSIVQVIIRFAPIGIFGLVAATIAATGFEVLFSYARLLTVLIGCMLIIALITNPLLVYIKIRRNPYPLVLKCLRESGVTAFFTRSSAANIPINMDLCKRLSLDEDTYSVSIPLGATINMAGAAITITVLTMATVHTLGIQVDLATALLLSIIAAVSACGASGVAGGSLLLIPLACSLFGIPNAIAMQVVAVGFILGVLQDSAETGLNSSTDVLFTAAACEAEQSKTEINT